jgi:peptide-methionine (S)-S-oxide reductase
MSRTLRLLLAASGLLIAAVVIAQVSAPGAGGSPASASGARGTAILAGGCFWCVEADFEKFPGVISAESGYMRGKTEKPTYSQVSAGGTGHVEVVRIVFDPARVSYAQLLDHFWRNIDPTVKDQQFCDVGDMYRSGIYFLDAAQQKAAEASPRGSEFGVRSSGFGARGLEFGVEHRSRPRETRGCRSLTADR